MPPKLLLHSWDDRQDQIFGLGAEAEFWAPDAEAGGDVVCRGAFMVGAPRFFVHEVGQEGDGPDLAAVGMAAELEVDFGGFGLFEPIGLVVDEDCEFIGADASGQFGEGAAG